MLDKILLVGDNALWHPVTNALGLTEGVVAPPQRLVDDRTLIVFDCRTARRDELIHPDSLCQYALHAGKPVLLLSPSAALLEALAATGGHWPKSPSEALVVARRSNTSGGLDTELSSLGHPATVSVSATHSAERDPKACEACDDAPPHQSPNKIPSSEAALSSFVTRLHRYAEKGGALSSTASMPDGLKYFQVLLSNTQPFSWNGNGPASITYAHSIWGFLNQTSSGPNNQNSQYVICEASTTALPGGLDHNDDEDRGVVLTDLVSRMYLQDTAFSAVQQVPTNGSGSWNETLSLPISYIDPITGQQIWTYQNSISQSIDSWSVQPGRYNDARTLGSEWQMVSPCRGGNLPSDFKDAFTDMCLVRDMSTASTNGAIFKTINVWNRPASGAGSGFWCGTYPAGAEFWSTGCVRWVCAVMHCQTYTPQMSVDIGLDFTSILP